MAIPLTCACGREFEVPDDEAGRALRCPVCGREHAVAGEEVPKSGKATASLVLGAMVFICACFSGLPAVVLGVLALREIDRSGGRLRGRGKAVAGVVLGAVGCLATAVLLPLEFYAAHEQVRRVQCANNLSQLGLAQQSSERLPPAAIADEAGRPLLSWRVAALAHVDSSDLYDEIRKNEPWDSPYNLRWLSARPYIYGCPADATLKPWMASYRVVVGPHTPFPPDCRPVREADITDGLGTTVLIAESRRAVPWTKPDEIPFDDALGPDGLGGSHGFRKNGFAAAFADGTVRFIRPSIDPRVLRALLTRDGGESISPGEFESSVEPPRFTNARRGGDPCPSP